MQKPNEKRKFFVPYKPPVRGRTDRTPGETYGVINGGKCLHTFHRGRDSPIPSRRRLEILLIKRVHFTNSKT